MNILLIRHIIGYLDDKYASFFNPIQKSAIDYININEDGLVTFKHIGR